MELRISPYLIRFLCVFFLCVSSVSLGWPFGPLGPLWPFGSGCGPSICLLLSRPGGTGAVVDPPPAPGPAAQAPGHTHTHTHTIPTHMLGETLHK